MARLTLAVLAVLVLACGSEDADPTGTPSAAMAVYCLEEPFGPYAGQSGGPVTWARHDGLLYVYFPSGRHVAIPPNQPACGLEYELARFAGEVGTNLSNHYSVHPDGGFAIGFLTVDGLDDRLAALDDCASSSDGAACGDLSVAVSYGPVTSPVMTLEPDEDEDLAVWLARTPPPPGPTYPGSHP